jgi:response regulator RpfG family c-di-GMP phosphodiesterase
MHDVLFVDDDPNLLQAVSRSLRGSFHVHAANNGEEGLRALQSGVPFAVVVSDMRMPSMNGVAFLQQARTIAPDVVRVMLTGNADQATAVQAVNDGAVFRFACKPCPKETMVPLLEAATRQHMLQTAEKQLLEGTLLGAVDVLTQVLALSDSQTFEQCQRVKGMIAQLSDIVPAQDRWAVESAALLSPIGMITVPPVVAARARKGHKLTETECQILARVPDVGYELLNRIPRLELVAEIVRHQSKDFDGGGKPDAAALDTIPLGARVLAIVRRLVELLDEGQDFDGACRALSEQPGRFDQALLARVREALRPAHMEASASSGTARSVTLAQVVVGHVLVEPVLTSRGTVLVSKGQVISMPLLERLRNFGRTTGIREPILVIDRPTSGS